MVSISSRFSTLQQNLFGRTQVESATSALQRAGKEMTTGLKWDVYTDLGPMAAVTVSLRAKDQQTQSYATANGVLSSKIDAMLIGVNSVRDTVADIYQNVIVNSAGQSAGTTTLQVEAEAAMKTIVATMNLSYNGDFLFSGIRSQSPALQDWESTNPDTGYSPKSILQSITGSGPTTTTEVGVMIAEIDAIYSSTYSSDPDMNFESTFYNGKPDLDSAGNQNARISARIESNRELEYGVQANDKEFRDLLKGLAMLAAVDVNSIEDKDTYIAWMEEVAESLSSGISGALTSSTRLGFYQQIIEDTVVRQNDLSFVYKTQINGFESVDPYEAATRINALETQLNATYSVSSRLSRLTILNYL
jgi:flagellar hook-associated protein 3 FlgL